jgi:hypothetical protein
MNVAQKIIDISSWQHVSGAAIDWAAVAASGVAGVIVKVTQGTSYANPYFASDYAEARAAGLLVGAYHFAEPVAGSAAGEAEWCNNHVMGLDLPLGLWLDLEVMMASGAYETAPWAQEWMAAVSVATRKTGIYMNQSFLTQMPQLYPLFPLWFATGGTETAPAEATIVQDAKALVTGIDGLVDQDLLISDRWVNPAGPTPPEDPDMPLSDEDVAKVATAVQTMMRAEMAGKGNELWERTVQAANESIYETGVKERPAPAA